MSPEQKQAAKERREADKNAALAANALARLPAEQERRDELWREQDALKAECQAAAGAMSAHKKRIREVFGITPQAARIREILAKCPDGVYEATCQQVGIFLKDMGRPFQLSMFDGEPGKGVAEDEGSGFDKTSAGERHSAERSDDPGRARKRKTSDAPPAAPSPALSAEEAQAGFEAANRAVEEKKSGKTKPQEGSFRAEQAGETAKGDEHIKKLRAGRSDDGPPPPPPGRKADPLGDADGHGAYTLN